MAFAYVGQIINPVSLEQLDYIEEGVLIVDNGKIGAFEKTTANLNDLISRFQVSPDAIKRLDSKQWLMPGFVDTHIHAPQYPNIGLGYDMPLLGWLENYTFPLEEKFADLDFAEKVYTEIVKRTLSCGTTTASYYATIHVDSALLLAEKALAYNQRAFVGKVNMDRDSPPGLLESSTSTIKNTENFIRNFPSSDIVRPVITPRFALACSMEAMKELSKIASREGINIQTHISENATEVGLCASLYPDSSSYSGVYGEAGLLTDKTILAHGVYLTTHEIQYIKKKGTAVAHCPNSNVSLQSGLCAVRDFLNADLKVGLGTDCSGGYSVSMMDSIRFALATSVAVSFKRPDLLPLSIPEVMYLAIQGGAAALGIENTTGSFAVGKSFDALVVDLQANPELKLLENYTLPQLLQKFIYLADDRNVTKVYVNGSVSVDKSSIINQ